MEGSKAFLTEFGIPHRLESCVWQWMLTFVSTPTQESSQKYLLYLKNDLLRFCVKRKSGESLADSDTKAVSELNENFLSVKSCRNFHVF